MRLTSEEKKIRKYHLQKMFIEFQMAIPYMNREDFEDVMEDLEDEFERIKGDCENEQD